MKFKLYRLIILFFCIQRLGQLSQWDFTPFCRSLIRPLASGWSFTSVYNTQRFWCEAAIALVQLLNSAKISVSRLFFVTRQLVELLKLSSSSFCLRGVAGRAKLVMKRWYTLHEPNNITSVILLVELFTGRVLTPWNEKRGSIDWGVSHFPRSQFAP